MFRRLMPKGLFGRALILIIAPIAVFQAVMIFIFLERHLDWVTRHLAGGMAGDVAFLVAAYDRFPDPVEEEALNRLAYLHNGLIAELEPDGPLPAAQTPGPFDLDWVQLSIDLNQRLARPMVVRVADDKRYVEIFVDLDGRLLHILAPRALLRSATTNLLFYWVVGLTVVLVPIALLFLRQQVKPMLRLAEAAENFGRGVEDPTYKPSGATEVRRAGMAFVQMRERIRRHIEQRTAMLAAVSHDLRTPLTRLKLELAMLGDTPEAADMRGDVDEMSRMLDAYLSFAQGQGAEEPVVLDLVELLNEVVAEGRRRGLTIAHETDQAQPAPIRRDSLKRCLTNLIDNAARYGRRVEIATRRVDAAVEILIDDDGPGIPEDKREEAFRPFVRLDPARDPNRSGVGLGLAIARDIARGHGGDLTLETAPIGGLRARLRLPA